jgi:phosphatidylglycerol---prolipoprotein diacylglyceryl transferase
LTVLLHLTMLGSEAINDPDPASHRPITIYSYGFMVALAFTVGDRFVTSEFTRRGYDAGLASTLVVWVAIASFGGRTSERRNRQLAYLFSGPQKHHLFKHRVCLLRRRHRGLLASIVFARRFRIRWLTLADMCAPALALAHAIGRQGCQLSGDLELGYTVQIALGHGLPQSDCGMECRDGDGSKQAWRPDPGLLSRRSRSSHAYLRERALLRRLSGTEADRKRTRVEGSVFYIFLMLYGASRFLVEFLRVNPRLLLGLSEAQLISLVMMIAGGAVYAASITRPPPASPMVGEA